MSNERRCPECGSPVSESGPAGGLCPRCLMKQGLPGESPTRTGGIGPGGFRPGNENLQRRTRQGGLGADRALGEPLGGRVSRGVRHIPLQGTPQRS